MISKVSCLAWDIRRGSRRSRHRPQCSTALPRRLSRRPCRRSPRPAACLSCPGCAGRRPPSASWPVTSAWSSPPSPTSCACFAIWAWSWAPGTARPPSIPCTTTMSRGCSTRPSTTVSTCGSAFATPRRSRPPSDAPPAGPAVSEQRGFRTARSQASAVSGQGEEELFHLRDVGLAWPAGVGQAVLQPRGDDRKAAAAERLVDGGELGEHVGAFGSFLKHPDDAAEVAMGALHPHDDGFHLIGLED